MTEKEREQMIRQIKKETSDMVDKLIDEDEKEKEKEVVV